ncbi:unnamed protein product [Didymodactylos carnosus]|nr:unnamed protein product [Didymodactylos carnosus]CAF4437849.1 unnamed protein product [Didymodactylos carnosus]
MLNLSDTTPILKQVANSDNLCDIIDILCVKNEFNKIQNISMEINQIARTIENYVFNHTRTSGTLSRLINAEEFYLIEQNQIPKAKWHANFFKLNNIKKDFLIHMSTDVHNTMLLFYNTIDTLLKFDDTTGYYPVNKLFQEIQKHLKNDIICKIRNILHAYSADWTPNKHKEIYFFQNPLDRSPSTRHSVKSVLLSRLLKEWSNKLSSVITNIHNKFI